MRAKRAIALEISPKLPSTLPGAPPRLVNVDTLRAGVTTMQSGIYGDAGMPVARTIRETHAPVQPVTAFRQHDPGGARVFVIDPECNVRAFATGGAEIRASQARLARARTGCCPSSKLGRASG